MKKLIVVRTNPVVTYTKLTLPKIELYAHNVNADFLLLNQNIKMEGDGAYHYKIMECYNLLDKYDRILNLDDDILIRKDCPNLFEIVPEDSIGTIYEDVGSRRKARRRLIRRIQEKFGTIGWNSGYINTGVFLVSKEHKNIFNKIQGVENYQEYSAYWEDIGWDDVHLGYQIKKREMKVFELSYKFNHMAMFSEDWNDTASRFDSYIIHYAGEFKFPDKENETKYEFIEKDLKKHKEFRI